MVGGRRHFVFFLLYQIMIRQHPLCAPPCRFTLGLYISVHSLGLKGTLLQILFKALNSFLLCPLSISLCLSPHHTGHCICLTVVHKDAHQHMLRDPVWLGKMWEWQESKLIGSGDSEYGRRQRRDNTSAFRVNDKGNDTKTKEKANRVQDLATLMFWWNSQEGRGDNRDEGGKEETFWKHLTRNNHSIMSTNQQL